MLLLEAPEIQIRKNVAEQNEAAIAALLENAQSFSRAAHFRAEVEIRQDQRVTSMDR